MKKLKSKVRKKLFKKKPISTKIRLQAWTILILMALFSIFLSYVKPFLALHISPLIIAVVLGSFFGNIAHKQTKIIEKTKISKFATKEILRLGIVLYGFKITLNDIAHVGITGLIFACFMVFSTFFIGQFIGQLIGLDKKSSILISSGSSICGAAAVLATESIVKGGGEKTAIAVCTVVIFGTFGMFAYPMIYKWGILDFSGVEMGFLIGGTLHEVAHVVAAGSGVGGDAADTSVIIKMIRVLMLVPFLLMLTIFSGSLVADGKHHSKKIKNSIPYFAIWFLVVVVFGSFLPEYIRKSILPIMNFIDMLLLSVAMLALGLGIRKKVLMNAGKKPFILALVLAIWLFVGGYLAVSFLLKFLN
ncbi:YeiH/YadS family membrane protein [Campylobacter blaseri]|uniref:YeiH family putative sulfate export transporter n=1 Tax=Campylobacter blaseri TaxID=2042961 RepID=A0A2P8R1F4_9BACT|nr:YeiH family putative sulfate export transporter [Campylobacter blaseri]PSM52323.1 YeiH family putative sulfate export transporter [Campylobacter blaseri]PSM54089.1 YeiH family putative sulfate export transporter [Campylobacter blaseri]QKF85531.1 YeiH/YadS family membrane protein [Campylobacter blaseri]